MAHGILQMEQCLAFKDLQLDQLKQCYSVRRIWYLAGSEAAFLSATFVGGKQAKPKSLAPSSYTQAQSHFFPWPTPKSAP